MTTSRSSPLTPAVLAEMREIVEGTRRRCLVPESVLALIAEIEALWRFRDAVLAWDDGWLTTLRPNPDLATAAETAIAAERRRMEVGP